MQESEWRSGWFEQFPEQRLTRRQQFLRKLFRTDRKTLHLVLFVLTFLSTYLVVGSILYSIGVMSILLFHEMGHYLMCRRYGIPATLPYFIPVPFPPFGTWGAVIAMHRIMPNRRVLFDVGAAGPIAGLILAFPITIIGLKYSTFIRPETLGPNVMSMGEPLVFQFLRYLVLGPLPEGMDVLIHPLAYAGWVGLFVTALNLLPVGQLDGGHIAYALLGPEKSRYVYYIALGGFAIAALYFPGWIFMLFLLAFFFLRHPPTMADYIPLDRKRKILGVLMFFVFVVSFTPVPFKI
jgi:membrane-associated protease RseP (regulator of RpoE activity)